MTQIAGPVATLTLPARRRGLGPMRLSLILGLTAMLLIVAQPRGGGAGACGRAPAVAGSPAVLQPACPPR
ncbi:MAG: hypothetical protein IE927_10940 [Rhodobacterales bacterium]|nr:hypothetical protein [Rhodobacterales bacterium]